MERTFIHRFKVAQANVLTCLLLSALTARLYSQTLVWGNNVFGQTNVPANATNVIALAAGDNHCLALRGDGTVVAWGGNYDGQTNVPTGLTNVVAIAAGSTHSLALRNDGSVAIWGRFYNDFTGAGTVVPPNVTNVVALALGPGAQHAVALRADGTVVDWGPSIYPYTNVPPTARNIVAVAAGDTYGLALRSDGQAVIWGNATFPPFPNPTNVVAIATGWFVDVGLRSDGTVLEFDNMTVLPKTGSSAFTNIADLACPFSSSGSTSIFGLRSDGKLRGYYPSPALPIYPTNQITAIGAGGNTSLVSVGSGPPIFVGLPVNRSVAAGRPAYFRSIASGAMPIFYQWSVNGSNILGATNSYLTVTNVQPGSSGNFYNLTASNSNNVATSGPIYLTVTPSEAYITASTLSALVGQKVSFTNSMIGQGPFTYQWEWNGTNLTDATNAILTVTNVKPSAGDIYLIIVGNEYGFVTNSVLLTVAPTILSSAPQSQTVFTGGTAVFSLGLQAIIPVAYQWLFNGTNINGATNNSLSITNVQYTNAGGYAVVYQDAYETVTNKATLSVAPVAVWGSDSENNVPLGLTNLIAVATGQMHTLVLSADGAITGWGNNSYGAATAPPGLTNVISIAAGDLGSIALQSDGTVVAWGWDEDNQTNLPSGLSNVVAIAACNNYNMALKSDGKVFVWGDNTYGQTNLPVGLSNVVAISAGYYHCLALKRDGTVVAWGAGTINTGNDPDFGQSIVPPNLKNVIQIGAGYSFSLALQDDGTLAAWGINLNGQLALPTGLTNIAAISAGASHGVALRTDGTVTTWGDNGYGETNAPAGLANVSVVCAGAEFRTVAIIGNGPPPAQAPILNPLLTTNGFSLSIQSQSGRVYVLEYENSLADNNWIPLPLAAGNGGILTLTDQTALHTQRYYRIRRW